MTQPDEFFPDIAFNAGSLADLAATGEEETEAQITGLTSAGPVSVFDMLCGTGSGLATGGHKLLTGQTKATVTGPELYGDADNAIKQNNAAILGGQAQTTATSIGLKAQNLLISQDFSNDYTVVTSDHWSWDGTDGDGKLGCAVVTCDGTQDPFVSNEIPVFTSESIEVSGRVKWSDLEYTGSNPIVLGVQKYRQGKGAGGGIIYRDIGYYEIDTIVAPAADSDWVDLAGVYVVEPRVDQLRFMIKADSNVTGGVVKWDNLNFLKLDLIPDGAVPGLGNNVDNIVTRLYGAEGEGFTRNDSAVALGNTASALSSASAKVVALEAEMRGGAVAGDDFAWTASELLDSTNWDGSYLYPVNVGHYSVDGVDAVFNGNWGSATPQLAKFIWQGEDYITDTDYQLIQVVLDSAPTEGGIGGSSQPQASALLFGRVHPSWASYVVAEFVSNGTWSVKSYADSAFHTIASGTCAVPGRGSVLSLYCGDSVATTKRRFKLAVGSTVLTDTTESGTYSVFGAENRQYGWGGWADGYLIWWGIMIVGAQGVAPNVNQWLGMDQ